MKRDKFNLSNYKLWTGDMGKLYPVGLMEVLPGDLFSHSTSMLMRLSPMAAPVMHPIQVRLEHWFVPHRLVWDGFEDFITGGPDGNDATQVPTVSTLALPKLLYDYLGVPPVDMGEVNALPLYGFNLIWNEYYRDQDLQTERTLNDPSIPNVAWEKDYFTTARPWEQKGDAITIPLGDKAPVYGIGATNQVYAGPGEAYETGQSAPSNFANYHAGIRLEEDPNNTGFPGIYADLTNASAATVNEWRRAMAMQRIAEARARYGSRYEEYLRYYGVNPRDGRLDKPEFLGGGRTQVNISEILQTAPESGGEPGTDYGVGDLYGHGIAAMRSNRYRKMFEEHGYVFTLASVRPKSMYIHGVDRTFLRRDREDFFQKEMQFIGQQPVWQGEVFGQQTTEANYNTFGFQDRYSEYKQQRSTIAGDFRNQLEYWHLGRDFESSPALNAAFIACNPSKRIFNVQTEDVLWAATQHKVIARRPVARSGKARII